MYNYNDIVDFSFKQEQLDFFVTFRSVLLWLCRLIQDRHLFYVEVCLHKLLPPVDLGDEWHDDDTDDGKIPMLVSSRKSPDTIAVWFRSG